MPDTQVRYLRVVGIGAADSSGNRRRYGRITNVTSKRVDVEFEDRRAGKYLVKEKAELVDKSGYSLIDSKPPFTKDQLEDMLTKPLNMEDLNQCRRMAMNWLQPKQQATKSVPTKKWRLK